MPYLLRARVHCAAPAVGKPLQRDEAAYANFQFRRFPFPRRSTILAR
ncbi:hypothetical protein BURMUCGD1_4436 [Burkholderia multivorans CGD1]|nr:hypothetical protein BURMUCGD1_4436 [Burkholderia multivorans CGD1]